MTLIGNLKQWTGGIAEIELDAANVKQLFAALRSQFPELGPHLDEGLAVAIDGQIYQDALLEPIAPESEVHILPQIAGG
ncbi:MAG: MoaD/ThiS family protein [Hyphomicrobiaceae bacterium]